jgi:hypothetical protein
MKTSTCSTQTPCRTKEVFFIPGVIQSFSICEEHLYVVYCEQTTLKEHSSDKLPVLAKRGEGGDCPFDLKNVEWITKRTLQIARFTLNESNQWSVLDVLKRSGEGYSKK